MLALDNTVYQKCPMALKAVLVITQNNYNYITGTHHSFLSSFTKIQDFPQTKYLHKILMFNNQEYKLNKSIRTMRILWLLALPKRQWTILVIDLIANTNAQAQTVEWGALWDRYKSNLDTSWTTMLLIPSFTRAPQYLRKGLLSKTSLLTKCTHAYKKSRNWVQLVVEVANIIMWRKKHPCHTKLCAFRCLISRPQNRILRSLNQIRGKLIIFQKLRFFRGSHFSQCFILSTAPHFSLPSKVLC